MFEDAFDHTGIVDECDDAQGGATASALERSDYHEVAAALGGRGVLLKNQDRVEACVNEARHAAGEGNPVLLSAWLDKTDFREGSLSM